LTSRTRKKEMAVQKTAPPARKNINPNPDILTEIK
jgi:hypothetical protein